MLVIRTSQSSGVTRTKDLPVTVEQMKLYEEGMQVQRVFPNLSAADREFILSGITDEEWKALFPPEDEE